MAVLFLWGGDVLPLRCHPLRFLGATSKVIIQARGLINQRILVGWKPLNGHRILNIRSQALIELGHFGALVLIDPGGVLRKPS
jgi:hypothetical protein